MKTEKKTDIKTTIEKFIKEANAFNIDTALTFFAANAVIDDVSVGNTFKNTAGVRKYLETFFAGYKTVTKIDALNIINENYSEVKVDFTGNFGHEKGHLNITTNTEGLIVNIDADLD